MNIIEPGPQDTAIEQYFSLFFRVKAKIGIAILG